MTYMSSNREIIKCPISGETTTVNVVYANGIWKEFKKATGVSACAAYYKHCNAKCSCIDSLPSNDK